MTSTPEPAPDALVLVPDHQATRLVRPGVGDAAETAWPPPLGRLLAGAIDLDGLRDPALRPAGVVESHPCLPRYAGLADAAAAMGFRAEGGSRRFVAFGYDWRRDVIDSADRLAARLDQLVAEGVERLHLVGHGLGGLIVRLLLECGRHEADQWFGRVASLIALGVPHRGLTAAAAATLGLGGLGALPAPAARTLARDPAWPSICQLLPAPGERSLWNPVAPGLDGSDLYRRDMARRLGLDPALLRRARGLHDVLIWEYRPAGIRYLHIAGIGHRTATRIDLPDAGTGSLDPSPATVVETTGAGDGLVALSSAAADAGQRALVVEGHAALPDSPAVHRLMAAVVGGVPAVPSEAAPEPPWRLSFGAAVHPAGRPIEAVLVPAPDRVAAGLDGAVRIAPVDADGRETGPAETIPLTWHGPAVSRLALDLPAIARPGLYAVSLQTDGAADSTHFLAVQATNGGADKS